jgi:hypothetical protein
MESTTVRTNSKQVKEAVQAYILQAIDFDSAGYGIENTLANALKTYKSEAGELERGQTYQDHFIDFMQGLPSWFNIEFTYFDIINRLTSWGLPKPANKNEQESARLFYYLIFREFTNLLKKEGLSIY